MSFITQPPTLYLFARLAHPAVRSKQYAAPKYWYATVNYISKIRYNDA